MAKILDVEKALNSKSKGKKTPKLLVWLLRKIVHENEINEFLERSNATSGIDFVDDALGFLDVKIEVFGLENIKDDKRYIFASNHPLGGLDGMALIKILGNRFRGKFKFLANDLLMNLPALRDISLPINKHGSQRENFSQSMEELFESDNQVMIFPAGMCSRYEPGKGICDLNWKKTFISKAVNHHRDIVPIKFIGRNSISFYILAYLRKTLGIKMNIEMLFLSHEIFKNKHETFKVYIGEPIPWETFDSSKPAHKWAQEVKEIVYKLK